MLRFNLYKWNAIKNLNFFESMFLLTRFLCFYKNNLLQPNNVAL